MRFGADSGVIQRRCWRAQWVALAAAALLLGLAIYLTDRAAGHAIWIPAVPALAGRLSFGALGGWMPSLLHPFAFALLTVAARAPHPRPAYGACLAWWAVNVVFEAVQHPLLSGPLAAFVAESDVTATLLRPFAAFAVRGTFDTGDIVAATLGALAAAAVLALSHRLETHHVHD